MPTDGSGEPRFRIGEIEHSPAVLKFESSGDRDVALGIGPLHIYGYHIFYPHDSHT